MDGLAQQQSKMERGAMLIQTYAEDVDKVSGYITC